MSITFHFPMYGCQHCGYKADRQAESCRGCKEGRPVGACEIRSCPDCAEARPLQKVAGEFAVVTVFDEQEVIKHADQVFVQPVLEKWEQKARSEVLQEQNARESKFSDGEWQRRVVAKLAAYSPSLDADIAAYILAHQSELATVRDEFLQRRAENLEWLNKQVVLEKAEISTEKHFSA